MSESQVPAPTPRRRKPPCPGAGQRARKVLGRHRDTWRGTCPVCRWLGGLTYEGEIRPHGDWRYEGDVFRVGLWVRLERNIQGELAEHRFGEDGYDIWGYDRDGRYDGVYDHAPFQCSPFPTEHSVQN